MFNRDSLENPVVLLGLAVLALAVITVGSSSGQFIMTLLHNATPDNEPIAQSTTSTTVDPDKIVARNFFGLADDKPVVAVEALPETKLELTLRGAFAAAENQAASAIIEEDSRRIARTYYVEDELPGNATLTAVYPDRVVLTRNNLLETLYFPDDVSSDGVGTRVNANAAPTSQAAPADDDAAAERRKAIRERIRQLRGRK